jgi:cytochrome c oxidase subunit 3
MVPSGVLAMAMFLATEVMFFAGLISAYAVLRAQTIGWPPLDQPRLPVALTAVNTLVLLASGYALIRARGALRAGLPGAARGLLIAAALGSVFLAVQGFEWIGLVREGLTLTSSTHGSFFYIIVGAHALHALAAVSVLGWALRRLSAKRLEASQLQAIQVYWYFVVGLWPLLYWQVYL